MFKKIKHVSSITVLMSICAVFNLAHSCGLRDNGTTWTEPFTGIEIQKCAVGATHTGGNSCSGQGQAFTWNEAMSQYEKGTWRMITIHEYIALSAQNLNILTNCVNSRSNWSWTSSNNGQPAGIATVSFISKDGIDFWGPGQRFLVRLVRVPSTTVIKPVPF